MPKKSKDPEFDEVLKRAEARTKALVENLSKSLDSLPRSDSINPMRLSPSEIKGAYLSFIASELEDIRAEREGLSIPDNKKRDITDLIVLLGVIVNTIFLSMLLLTSV